MSLLLARTRSAAGLLGATALMLLLAATIVCAVWLQATAVPRAGLQSLVRNAPVGQQTITLSVVDRTGTAVEPVDQYLASLTWPTAVALDRSETQPQGGWPTITWQLRPELSRLDPADYTRLVALVGELESGSQLPGSVRIDSTLGSLLAETQRQTTVIRSSAYVTAVATALLAGLELALGAQLLAAARAREFRLLRARGFSSGQLASLSSGEAALVALPAALVAPPLAWLLVRVVGGGFGATSGSTAGPGPISLPLATWLISAAVAVAGALALVWLLQRASALAIGSAVGGSADGEEEVEPTGRAAVLRSGVDALAIVLAALACWQLWRYGAPWRTLPGGALGIDPFIVAAPALVLLAGALLTLRVLLWAARRLDRPVGATLRVGAPLGIWQVARRPSRHAGPVLLLVLAIALGALSATYARSWTTSLAAQADQAAGADLRVLVPPTPIPGLGGLENVQTMAHLPGVAAALPVTTATVSGELPSMQMFAWNADLAPDVVLLRADTVTTPDAAGLAAASATLLVQRPATPVVELPDGTQSVSLTLDAAGDVPSEVVVNLVLQDAFGGLHRTPRAMLEPGQTTDVPVAPESASGTAGVGLLAVELSFPAAADSDSGPLIVALRARARTSDGEVALTPPAAWRATSHSSNHPEVLQLAPGVASDLVRFELAPGSAAQQGGLGELALRPATATDPAAGALSTPETNPVIPVLATFGQITPIRATVAGQSVYLQPVGRIAALPGEGVGTANRTGFIVDAPTLARALYEARGAIMPVSAWWLSLAGSTDAAKAASAVQATAVVADVPGAAVVAERAGLALGLRTDPLSEIVQAGGRLALVAAAIAASIGVAVGAVVALRERRTELAVLRALGIGPRQVRAALLIEQGLQYLVSAILGTALGIALAAVLLPRLLVDSRGLAPRPSAQLAIGWPAIVLLLGLIAAAVLASVLTITRTQNRGSIAATLRSSNALDSGASLAAGSAS